MSRILRPNLALLDNKMKRKLLIILSCGLVLVGVLFFCVSYFSTAIFGESPKQSCGTKVLNSIPVGDGKASISVEDEVCDGGLVVSGSFKVLLRYREQERAVDKVVLVANNMGSNSHAPEVKVLAPFAVVVIAQKDMVFEKGPVDVGGIRFTYELK